MDLETGRQVAIKLPHPEMESDEVSFEREQEIGHHLHPSRNYMVTEWSEGKLLRQILNQQKLSR